MCHLIRFCARERLFKCETIKNGQSHRHSFAFMICYFSFSSIVFSACSSRCHLRWARNVKWGKIVCLEILLPLNLRAVLLFTFFPINNVLHCIINWPIYSWAFALLHIFDSNLEGNESDFKYFACQPQWIYRFTFFFFFSFYSFSLSVWIVPLVSNCCYCKSLIWPFLFTIWNLVSCQTVKHRMWFSFVLLLSPFIFVSTFLLWFLFESRNNFSVLFYRLFFFFSHLTLYF